MSTPDTRVYALSWSGGKDAMLALDRAVRQELDVRYLFNIIEGSSGQVRFHGLSRELIARQAEALGLAALGRVFYALERRGVCGILFGNIHLTDIRGWYEERVTARGFAHGEPLWGTPPTRVLDEFVERGYRAVVVSVNLELGREEWLGRELDTEFAAELAAFEEGCPAGEHGEYHTFVFDGPLFRAPIPFTLGEVWEREGHRLVEVRAGTE